MRKRSIAVAVLVAAALSVVTAGAASAGEPDDERGPMIVTCENGEIVTREPTEEERERLRTRHHRVEPGDRALRVVPAEPGAPPPVTCDADGPRAPRLERVQPAVPAPPR
jgi:hypothetical protein